MKNLLVLIMTFLLSSNVVSAQHNYENRPDPSDREASRMIYSKKTIINFSNGETAIIISRQGETQIVYADENGDMHAGVGGSDSHESFVKDAENALQANNAYPIEKGERNAQQERALFREAYERYMY